MVAVESVAYGEHGVAILHAHTQACAMFDRGQADSKELCEMISASRCTDEPTKGSSNDGTSEHQ